MLAKRNEYSLGIGVVLFSMALILYIIPQLVVSPRNVANAVLAPDFWPNVIAWMMLAIGIGIVAQQFLNKDKSKKAAKGIPSRVYFIRLFKFMAFMAGYYALIPLLGMVWASSLAFIVFSIVIADSRYRVTAVIVGILLPLALYAFFYHGAGVDIPQSNYMRLP
ncbi:MAG: tripartite tricarboxylate transporter TctB family protein [Motiliproteus sp.]